jgi:NTE family protein
LYSAGTLRQVLSRWLILCCIGGTAVLSRAQTPQAPASPAQKAPSKPAGPPASTTAAGGPEGAQGGDSKSAVGADAKQSASGTVTHLSPLDPSVAPPKVFQRPRIGVALGGGGAVGLSEVGVLQWFEEHHIPVDVIAGTSMGCLVSSLYSTGRTPQQLSHIVDDQVFAQVFSFGDSYTSRSFRRREESRELPNGVTIGLKHGVSFRNAVLIDQGLNAFLDREFLRYDDQTDFNNLPIPLRCLSTDLDDAKSVTFARGSIPDAVRASVSLPGIFPPFEMNGHEYVDGGVLVNLPTATVRAMNADVVLAISLPLAPVAKGQLGSLLGVLQRSFGVAIENTERQQRKLADVVIMPDITGFTSTDYLKSGQLAQRGYEAAEKNRDALLKYSLSDADWQAYLAHRASLMRGPAAPVLSVRVTAPDGSSRRAIQRLFAPLVNQPVDTAKIEALLDQVRSDGAFDADYSVGYETAKQFAAQKSGAMPLPAGTVEVPVQTAPDPGSQGKPAASEPPRPGAPVPKPGTTPSSNQPGVPKTDGTQPEGAQPDGSQSDTAHADQPGAPGLAATQTATAESLADIAARPIILVTVTRKKIGPPFLILGANVEAATSSFTRATIQAFVLDQDLGSYGSELRSTIKLGYLTELGTEYFHPLNPLSSPEHTIFIAPRADFLREPFPIFTGANQVANRQLQRFDAGADLGWTNQRTQRFRAGYDFQQLHWDVTSGTDGQPDFSGQAQRVRLQYDFDTQDRALVPQYGVHVSTEAAFLYSAVNSPNAPELFGQVSFAHRFSLHKAAADSPKDPNRGHEVFLFGAEGGTLFDRNVAQPFRFTLGGPLRLSASEIDQYRGTDYFLVEPAILRRIAQLPQPLGQSIYLGLGVEAAQIHAPGLPVINRQDGYFGLVAETPLGVITLAPAIGSNGERRLVFTLGKLF